MSNSDRSESIDFGLEGAAAVLSSLPGLYITDLAMKDFAMTDDCRRLILGKYFDRSRIVHDCISGNMSKCDQCFAEATDWQRSESNAVGEKEIVGKALNQMSIGCPTCRINWALDKNCFNNEKITASIRLGLKSQRGTI